MRIRPDTALGVRRLVAAFFFSAGRHALTTASVVSFILAGLLPSLTMKIDGGVLGVGCHAGVGCDVKLCPWCRREVPEGASTCPYLDCARPLDPAGGLPSGPPEAPPIQLPVGGACTQSPPVDLRSRAASLASPPRRRWFRGRLAAAVLLGAACIVGVFFWQFYPVPTDDNGPGDEVQAGNNASVSRYAELDPRADIVLERDPERPDRINVVYSPTTHGEVVFGLAGQSGQWSDRVAEDEVGEDHVFAWPSADLKPDDVIRVTFRRGDGLATQELRVAEARQATAEAPQGLYARRTMADRKSWIGQYGGSEASETAVADALEWLARHQADDGSWSDRCVGTGHPEAKCEKEAPCSGPGGPYEMALSGLAVLAFQAGGHYDFNGNRYSENVRRAIDWMLGRQRPDGALLGSKQDRARRHFYQQFMYEHAIATFALADACAVSQALGRPKDPRYAEALEKAVRFIYEMQHDDGGWRYTDRREQPSDTSVTGWPVLALKSAREAGASLDATCVEKTRAFFEARATGERGRTGYLNHTLHTEATTGVGMLARQFLLDQPESPYVRDAAAYLAEYAGQSWPDRRADSSRADYYLWYNCTLAMFQAGGEAWKRWNDVVRDTIVGLQRHEGCPRGSWDPDGRWGHEGGRIYSTALAALTLEVYYRYANLTEAAKRSGASGEPETAFPLIRRKKP